MNKATTHPYRLPASILAVSIAAAGLGLAGCNRTEPPASSAPATAPAPASSAPAAAPASSAPAAAPAPAPTTSATTPGTSEGAANTLPSSSDSNTAPPSAGTAVDAKETEPRDNLTKQEENKGMPEALQSNNHSSTALDGDAKKP